MTQTSIALFGPAGLGQDYADKGYSGTAKSAEYLTGLGLTALEYSLGRGVTIGQDSAHAIGESLRGAGIALSVHAPYFVNLATDDPARQERNVVWLGQACQVAQWMGADRVIFHPGSALKGNRALAMELSLPNLAGCIAQLTEQGLMQGVMLCPETMGKNNQLGSVDEIIVFCREFGLVPCLDFGHIHTVGQGCILSQDDAAGVLDTFITGLGHERMANCHVHFSHIEYSTGGEVRHRTFAEEGYGPDFAHVAPAIKAAGLAPRFICESAGTQALDAAEMRELWDSL